MPRSSDPQVPAVLRSGSADITVIDGNPPALDSLYHRLQLVSVQTFLQISAGIETLPPQVIDQIKDLQLEFSMKLDDEPRRQEIAEIVTNLLFRSGFPGR